MSPVCSVLLSSVPTSFRPTLLRLCCSPIWTMQLLHGFGLAVLLQPTAYGLAPSFAWPRSITGAPSRGKRVPGRPHYICICRSQYVQDRTDRRPQTSLVHRPSLCSCELTTAIVPDVLAKVLTGRH